MQKRSLRLLDIHLLIESFASCDLQMRQRARSPFSSRKVNWISILCWQVAPAPTQASTASTTAERPPSRVGAGIKDTTRDKFPKKPPSARIKHPFFLQRSRAARAEMLLPWSDAPSFQPHCNTGIQQQGWSSANLVSRHSLQ